MAGSKKYHLPIHVDEDVLEKNPKFSSLMQLLSSKLTQDGISIQTKREAEMAEKNVCLAHQGWLMSHIPYYELKELITEFELKNMEGSLSLDEKQLTEVLSDAVAICELGDYLPLPSDSSHSPTVMGLTQEELDRHNHTKQHFPVIRKAVIPILERRLQKKGKDLFNFFTTDTDLELKSDWIKSLPSLVEQRKQQLARDKAAFKALRETKRKHFLLYYQTLLQCLSSMDQLIRHHKLEVNSVTVQNIVDWMDVWCGAICTVVREVVPSDVSPVISVRDNFSYLKLLKLTRDTYTPETISALKVIRKELDKTIAETERQLSSTTQQVDAYRAAGSEFKTLVDQYTLLKNEIDKIKWGLEFIATAQSGQKTE